MAPSPIIHFTGQWMDCYVVSLIACEMYYRCTIWRRQYIKSWEMINLLSENFSDLEKYYSEKNKIYLYNKNGKKTKRKLGHINRLIN